MLGVLTSNTGVPLIKKNNLWFFFFLLSFSFFFFLSFRFPFPATYFARFVVRRCSIATAPSTSPTRSIRRLRSATAASHHSLPALSLSSGPHCLFSSLLKQRIKGRTDQFHLCYSCSRPSNTCPGKFHCPFYFVL